MLYNNVYNSVKEEIEHQLEYAEEQKFDNYLIIEDRNVVGLQTKVNIILKIKNGWRVSGNVTTYKFGGQLRFAQTIMKK